MEAVNLGIFVATIVLRIQQVPEHEKKWRMLMRGAEARAEGAREGVK
jgi:hypothetical protein